MEKEGGRGEGRRRKNNYGRAVVDSARLIFRKVYRPK